MRCAKCGYTSFDYLDRCRSCGDDLVPSKIKLNIYTKPPKIDVTEDGFAVGRVGGEEKDLLTSSSEVPSDDILTEDENLESFEFDDDKNS